MFFYPSVTEGSRLALVSLSVYYHVDTGQATAFFSLFRYANVRGYCSLRSQQLGQNSFQITFGDGILPRMSRDITCEQ